MFGFYGHGFMDIDLDSTSARVSPNNHTNLNLAVQDDLMTCTGTRFFSQVTKKDFTYIFWFKYDLGQKY